MSYSQDQVRQALTDMGDDYIVYKPPDDARNWKPCDFMVWWQTGCAWVEVKQNVAVRGWRLVLRPSQRASMLQAYHVALPYIAAVYWKRRNYWTLHQLRPDFPASVTFELAVSRYGVGAAPANLALTLRGVIHQEAGL